MIVNVIIAIVAVCITLLIAVPVTSKVAVDKKVREDAEKIGTAEQKARNIIDEALKTAETKKREALLEAKEESLKTKNEVEKETRERRAELQKYEKRVLSKEESIDRKADALERRENDITAKEAEIKKKENKKVVLTIYRDKKSKDYTVKKSSVQLDTVSYKMKEKKIGYIAVSQFLENTGDQFDKAVTALEKKGMKSLIIDLRDLSLIHI